VLFLVLKRSIFQVKRFFWQKFFDFGKWICMLFVSDGKTTETIENRKGGQEVIKILKKI
jgi:hypothetical protein